MKTPVLFLVFNRPDTTKRVFEVIRKVKPQKLFIAADGPRKNRIDDIEKCKKVKEIVNKIDWKCEVKTLFRTENLGCKMAVRSAITWFFENVDAGIILEDDCLPDESFFEYCSYLLDKYAKSENVMHIGGNNFQKNKDNINAGYYLSKYPHIWGWATWKRSWNKYIKLENDKSFIPGFDFEYGSLLERIYWLSLFLCVKWNLIDTWDYQWVYSIWANKSVCISPVNNLVVNIGIGKDSTHTSNANDNIMNVVLEKCQDLKYSSKLSVNKKFDNYTLKNVFGVKPSNIFKILSIVPYNLYKSFRNA